MERERERERERESVIIVIVIYVWPHAQLIRRDCSSTLEQPRPGERGLGGGN